MTFFPVHERDTFTGASVFARALILNDRVRQLHLNKD